MTKVIPNIVGKSMITTIPVGGHLGQQLEDVPRIAEQVCKGILDRVRAIHVGAALKKPKLVFLIIVKVLFIIKTLRHEKGK